MTMIGVTMIGTTHMGGKKSTARACMIALNGIIAGMAENTSNGSIDVCRGWSFWPRLAWAKF